MVIGALGWMSQGEREVRSRTGTDKLDSPLSTGRGRATFSFRYLQLTRVKASIFFEVLSCLII